MEKRLLNIKELSEYLGVSIQTLYQWVSQHKIPFIKLGRLRFDIRKIDRWVEERSVDPKNF